MKTTNSKYPPEIKNIFLQRKVSMTIIALALGITPAYLSSILLGKMQMPLWFIENISGILYLTETEKQIFLAIKQPKETLHEKEIVFNRSLYRIIGKIVGCPKKSLLYQKNIDEAIHFLEEAKKIKW